MPLINMPAFQASPLLDLSPIAQGLRERQRQMEVQQQRDLQERQFAEGQRQFNAQNALAVNRDTREQTMLPEDIAAKRAATQHSLAGTAQSRAMLEQIKMQTPDWRLDNAERFGVDVNTPEGKQFVISGQYQPPGITVGHAPEGSVIYQNNPKTGKVDFLSPPNASGGYDKHFTDAIAKKNAEDVQTARKNVVDAEATGQSIGRLGQLVDQAYTGTGADARAAAARLLGTVGASPDSWKNATTATEALRAGLGELVAKKAGPLKPLSNSDIAFVQRMVGDPSLSSDGVKHILGTLGQISKREALFNQRYSAELQRTANPDVRRIIQDVAREVPDYASTIQQSAPQSGGGWSIRRVE